MVTPGHPFETAELDKLRSQQRRVLSTLRALATGPADFAVPPSDKFSRDDLIGAELFVRRQVQRLEADNENVGRYVSACELLAGRKMATRLRPFVSRDLASPFDAWEKLVEPEPSDTPAVRNWVRLASFADSLAAAAEFPR